MKFWEAMKAFDEGGKVEFMITSSCPVWQPMTERVLLDNDSRKWCWRFKPFPLFTFQGAMEEATRLAFSTRKEYQVYWIPNGAKLVRVGVNGNFTFYESRTWPNYGILLEPSWRVKCLT